MTMTRTVEFGARIAGLTVAEVKGGQVLKVPLVLPHSLDVLAGLAALLGQDVTVTIAPLQLTFEDAAAAAAVEGDGSRYLDGALHRGDDYVDPETGEVQAAAEEAMGRLALSETEARP